ncbi:MAG TPA: short-chain dehydrogenase/reductase [Thermoanaerobaculia bacterium]|nr:short-chain dehydrogenase/reductase [Thermoanaerobaculia bacterium]
MHVFITGPARGIGAALARQLAARGARVALAGLEPDRLAELARELGPQHVWFECDVTDQVSVVRAVEGTMTAFGSLDVVVANAGIASHGTVAITPIEALERVVAVNLMGVIRTVHATLPHLTATRGYYLLISSAAAIAAAGGMATYCGTKAGVEQFGNALRLELLHKGVDVGIAHPAWIDTDLVRDTRRELASFNDMLRKMPPPFSTVTPLEVCVDALVKAIDQRERKIFIPKSLRYVSMLRHFFMSRFVDRQTGKNAGRTLAKMEAEVQARGRVFGENSVESRR